MKLDADTEKRLEQLENFVATYGRGELEPTDFWDGFHAIAGPLDDMAFSDDADPASRERYTAILSIADELGFMAPVQDT